MLRKSTGVVLSAILAVALLACWGLGRDRPHGTAVPREDPGDFAGLIRRLPEVEWVEVLVPADRPTHRIVHVRDWHFVPRTCSPPTCGPARPYLPPRNRSPSATTPSSATSRR